MTRITPSRPPYPLPKKLYDITLAVTEEVYGKGELPLCRVCMQHFNAGDAMGWAYSPTVGSFIGVHGACHDKPLKEDLTPEDHLKCSKAKRRIYKEPCICDTDTITRRGCQCGGV